MCTTYCIKAPSAGNLIALKRVVVGVLLSLIFLPPKDHALFPEIYLVFLNNERTLLSGVQTHFHGIFLFLHKAKGHAEHGHVHTHISSSFPWTTGHQYSTKPHHLWAITHGRIVGPGVVW